MGGSSTLRDNPSLLTATSTILTTEARHDAYLRLGLGGSPFPTSFDTPLAARFAYSLARSFVKQCPAEANLPIQPLPKLTLMSPVRPVYLNPPLTPGTTLTFAWDMAATKTLGYMADRPLHIAFLNQDMAPVYRPLHRTGVNIGTVALPSGISGMAFAVLTPFSGSLTAAQLAQSGALAGPAQIVCD